jgi:hypothetical protein
VSVADFFIEFGDYLARKYVDRISEKALSKRMFELGFGKGLRGPSCARKKSWLGINLLPKVPGPVFFEPPKVSHFTKSKKLNKLEYGHRAIITYLSKTPEFQAVFGRPKDYHLNCVVTDHGDTIWFDQNHWQITRICPYANDKLRGPRDSKDTVGSRKLSVFLEDCFRSMNSLVTPESSSTVNPSRVTIMEINRYLRNSFVPFWDETLDDIGRKIGVRNRMWLVEATQVAKDLARATLNRRKKPDLPTSSPDDHGKRKTTKKDERRRKADARLDKIIHRPPDDRIYNGVADMERQRMLEGSVLTGSHLRLYGGESYPDFPDSSYESISDGSYDDLSYD